MGVQALWGLRGLDAQGGAEVVVVPTSHKSTLSPPPCVMSGAQTFGATKTFTVTVNDSLMPKLFCKPATDKNENPIYDASCNDHACPIDSTRRAAHRAVRSRRSWGLAINVLLALSREGRYRSVCTPPR